MTAALAAVAGKIEVPPIPGISARAVRQVFAAMARVAGADGTFRYGMRGRKVGEFADYSLSVVRRAQRWLVANQYLIKVKQGGGRTATRWALNLAKLGIGGPAQDTAAGRPETAQRAGEDTSQTRDTTPEKIYRRRSAPEAAPTSPALPLRDDCPDHPGFLGGRLPSGGPRCPKCRRAARRSSSKPLRR